MALDKNISECWEEMRNSKSSMWQDIHLADCTTSISLPLSPSEFRDALAIRYHQPLSKVPADCDGCGAEFTLQHALDCRKGGLIIQGERCLG